MSRVGSELKRKAVHVSMGGFALALRWLTPTQAALCAAGALVFNLLVLHRLTGRALLREGERKDGFSWGIALYPAVVLGLILVFRGHLELAAAVWGLVAFGDGMATVAGVLFGGPRLPWNRDKSWVGFVAFVTYGTAAAALLIRWTQKGVLGSEHDGPVTWIGSSFLETGASGVAPLTFLVLGCLAAAFASALAESADTGIDDNLLVPLIGGATIYAASLVRVDHLIASGGGLSSNAMWGLVVNLALAGLAYASGGVGISGAIWGTVLGTALYAFAGWPGFLMLVVFFVFGTATTKLGYARKAALGIAQEKGGRRGGRHAFANTLTGVICAFLALATDHREAFTIGMVAAFATALCDTASSEIGQAFGRRHYLVTTLRRVSPGTDGAVSVEGTAGGILAAAVLASIAWGVGLVSPWGAGIVVIAAFIGATLESYVGATLERLTRLDNEMVNFSNTVAGAAAGLALYYMT